MVRPLVENVDQHLFALVENAVLRQHGDAQRGEQFADAVVDFGVDVVRPPRQHDDRPSLFARFGEDLFPFRAHVGIVSVQAGEPFGEPRLYLARLDLPAGERPLQCAHRRLFVVQIEIRHDEIFVVQPFVVRLQKFRIVRHDGAVVMVDRIVLVQIVALAGEENEIDALVQKAFDVPVRKLGGIADGVAGDGVLPPEIQAAGGLLAQNDFEAARLEKARPQRELFVVAERERKPHPAPLSFGAGHAF